MGFPGGSDSKESTGNAEHLGSTPGSGRSPGEGNANPPPVFLPGEFHLQRRLASYSPWGLKESEMTEQLTHNSTEKISFRAPCYKSLVESLFPLSGLEDFLFSNSAGLTMVSREFSHIF